MDRRTVAVTGAAGRVGSILTRGLTERYDVVALDRHIPARGAIHRVSINRMPALIRAFRGADTVIHLAADPRLGAPWRSALRTNIKGTWNVLDAARTAGVRRLIFASSNAVTAGYEREMPWASVIAGEYDRLDADRLPRISSAHAVRPTGPYAVSKVFGEAACRYYSDRFGLSVVCIRIGSVYTDNRPHSARDFATWLSNPDLIRLVSASIEADLVGNFAVFYGVSANKWRIFDTDEISAAIGVRPVDDAESWRLGSQAT